MEALKRSLAGRGTEAAVREPFRGRDDITPHGFAAISGQWAAARVTAVAKFLLIAIERKLRPANFAS